jgi:uncharacterized damage-inducible protein DinB
MAEPALLADLVDRVMIGDPWHAGNVLSVLDGLSADDAARAAVPNAHSIWELVLHMTGWAREVLARLEGAPAGEPAAGDWPALPAITEAAWDRDRAALFEVHAALAAAIRRTPPAQLDEPVADHRDRAAGTGLSKALTLHGLVHHTVHHAGQIALLRRALDR